MVVGSDEAEQLPKHPITIERPADNHCADECPDKYRKGDYFFTAQATEELTCAPPSSLM
jgi:hypothetical protein